MLATYYPYEDIREMASATRETMQRKLLRVILNIYANGKLLADQISTIAQIEAYVVAPN